MAVLTSTLVLCMALSTCVGQFVFFEPIEDDCTKYRFTFMDFSDIFTCQENTVFSSSNMRCVPRFSFRNNQCPEFTSTSDVARMCAECQANSQEGEECIFAHDGDCSRYFNCSKIDRDPFDKLPPFGEECEYPQLFSTAIRRCDDFERVICGKRKEPKNPCDYVRNQCGTSHCAPCRLRFPDCENLRDGIQAWPERKWTPYFVECRGQRTLNVDTCPSDRNGEPRIFSADNNRCDTLRNIPRKYGGFQDDEEN